MIQAGPITFAKFGRMIYGQKNQTPEQHRLDLQRFSDQLPAIIKRIDDAVARAAEIITSATPLDLLTRAATIYAVTQMGVEVEADVKREHTVAYRMIDYVQNVIASAPPKAEQHTLSDDEWSSLKKTVEEIFDLVNLPYQIARSARAQISDSNYDRHFDEFMFRAQVYWTAVRGDRYPSHAIEQLRTLLTLHDAILRKLFNTDAESLVHGVKALQESLTSGLLKAGQEFNAFRERVIAETEKLIADGATGEPVELMRRVAQSAINAADRADIFDRMFGSGRFDVARVTKLPDDFLRELSWAPGEETTFFAPGEFAGWPLRIWPSQRRPFLNVNGKYYCFDAFFPDDLYRGIQRLVTRLQPSYSAEWNAKQKEASESAPVHLLTKLLRGSKSYRSVYYLFKPAGASKAEWFESDALVVYDDWLFVVEVKAGATTYTSPATDFDAHVKSARDLLERPLEQGRRFKDYLESLPEVSIFNDQHAEIGRLRRSDFRQIIVCAVTLDHLTEVAAQIEHLSSFGVSVQPGTVWAFSLDDLRILTDVFHNPLLFMHYVEQRLRAAASTAVKLDDELDHLGLFLAHGDYRAYAESIIGGDEPPSFYGYRSEIDKYYNARTVDPTTAIPPAPKMAAHVSNILDVLAAKDIRGRTVVANALLDLSSNQRQSWDNSIARGIEDAMRDLARPIAVPSTPRMTLVCRIASRPFSRTDIRRHALANAIMLNESERLLLELTFNEDADIHDVNFEVLRTSDLTAMENEKVRKIAEGLLQQRFAKAGDVGRNDPCPCGSGKKLKKCHAR